jgi:hypothetical protein
MIRFVIAFSRSDRPGASSLWTSGDQSANLPTVVQMMQGASNGVIDGAAYDHDRAIRTPFGMW